MNIQRATTLEERRFHLCPPSVIRLQKVSRATCLVPQSLGPPAVVRGYLVFLKRLVKAFGGARARVLPPGKLLSKCAVEASSRQLGVKHGRLLIGN